MSKALQDIPYPRFVWPRPGWWFTVLGTLVGVAVLVFPDLSSLGITGRCAVAAGLIAGPGLIIALIFMMRIALTFCRRAVGFKKLLGQIVEIKERLVSTEFTVLRLVQERRNRNAYSIAHCHTYDNRTFIALRRKRGRKLSVGQKITVVDCDGPSVMGHFNIIREDGEYYVCELQGYMDALWLGNIKQHGSQHSQAPPEALAIAISEETGDEDE